MDNPFTPFPVLETERFRLRRLEPADAGALFGWLSDPEVTRHFGIVPLQDPTDARQVVEHYAGAAETGTAIRWGIEERATGELVGSCGFHAWVALHARAEVGYEVTRSRWRTGVMREALPAALRFGFEEMGLHRIGALVAPANEASLRLLDRLGFTREGTLRHYECTDGHFDDLVSHSLLRGELPDP